MRRLTIVVVVLLSVVGSACVLGERGSGVATTRRTPLSDTVARVEISSAFDAVVQVGSGSPEAVVTIDDNLVDHLRVTVHGDTVRIALDGSVTDPTLHASVAVATLAELDAAGTAHAEILGTVAGDVRLEASGASTIRAATIDAGRLDLEASGASDVEASGSADRIDASVSGASHADLGSLLATVVSVEASGASLAEVFASDELDARASGASTVTYAGAPTEVSKESSGASTVEPA